MDVRIAFVGGGSLNWAPTLMGDLAFDGRLRADVRLYDIDVAAAARNARMGEQFAQVSRGPASSYTAVPTLAAALEGADVVVISILPGRLDEMAHDLSIPADYGVAQAVGDTVGPGGFVRAMRAIPMLYEIGAAIREHAPDAFVCNLTNPMSVLTGALYRAFPGIKAWGECHEVVKLRRQVATLVNDRDGTNWDARDVAVNVLGVNHFTFVDQIRLGGRDEMPTYQAFAEAHRGDGTYETVPGKDAAHDKYFSSRCLVKFDLTAQYGVAAAAGDRHLAEFLPHETYMADPAKWGFACTPVAYRTADQKKKQARAAGLAAGEVAPVAKRSDEALVDQIAALMGGTPVVTNVNLPNVGQLEGITQGAVVETNAVFGPHGVKPVVAGQLPAALAPIVADHADRQTALLDAVVAKDKAALLPLFQSDPLVRHLTDHQTAEMFARMRAATAAYLPNWLQEAA